MSSRKPTKNASVQLAALVEEGLSHQGVTALAAARAANIDPASLSLIRDKKLGVSKDKGMALAQFLKIPQKKMAKAAGYKLTEKDMDAFNRGMFDLPSNLSQAEAGDFLELLGCAGCRKGHILEALKHDSFGRLIGEMIALLCRARFG